MRCEYCPYESATHTDHYRKCQAKARVQFERKIAEGERKIAESEREIAELKRTLHNCKRARDKYHEQYVAAVCEKRRVIESHHAERVKRRDAEKKLELIVRARICKRFCVGACTGICKHYYDRAKGRA